MVRSESLWKLVLMLGAVWSASRATAQPYDWHTVYNSPANKVDAGAATAVDSQGNVYVGGYCQGATGDFDTLLVKYDLNGAKQWVRRYDGVGHGYDAIRQIAIDSNDDIVVAGLTTNASFNPDCFVAKYDGTGRRQWVQTYDSGDQLEDSVVAIGLDAANNVYIAGESSMYATQSDYVTIKFASNGAKLWTRRWTAEGAWADDRPTALVIDHDGNCVVTGTAWDPVTGLDFGTIKYDPSGTLLWEKRLSGGAFNASDTPRGIVSDGTSNTIVIGEADHRNANLGMNWMVAKYAPNGDLLWSRYYDDPYNQDDSCYAATVLPDGRIVATGTVTDLLGYSHVATVQFSPEGTPLWLRVYRGPAGLADRPISAVADGSSNTIILAESRAGVAQRDCLVLKIAANGATQWVRRFGTLPKDEYGTGLTIDAQNHPIVCGMRWRNTNYDLFAVKYKP